MTLIDYVPTWGLLIITVIITYFSFEIGFFWAKHRGPSSETERKAPVGSILGATLGLLAFILAFTFGFAATRYQERRILVVDDANAIETTYRRAGFLPEPNKKQIRDLLYEYVNIRSPSPNYEVLKKSLEKSEELQDQLWAQAVIVAENNPNSVMSGLFIGSLNQMIDLHAKRVLIGARTRIPIVIWGALYFVTILSMAAMGYYSGLMGARSPLVNFVMIFAFSGIIFLIADLDSPQTGVFQVSQQPMTDLLKKISSSKIQ